MAHFQAFLVVVGKKSYLCCFTARKSTFRSRTVCFSHLVQIFPPFLGKVYKIYLKYLGKMYVISYFCLGKMYY